MRRQFGWLLFLLLVKPASSHANIPLQINHQGIVSINGLPYSGTGQFRFALIEKNSGLALWSNDGSTEGTASIPADPVAIEVSEGLYSVQLGDTGVPHMTAIPSTVFDSSEVLLRIWFDDGSNGLRQLAPDQALGSVPYAIQAGDADTATHALSADIASEATHAAIADVATTALDSLPSGLLVLNTTSETLAGFSSTGIRVEGQDSSWTPAAPMDTAVGSAAAAVLDGRLHVFSGLTDMSLETAHQVYNPENDEWSVLDPLPVGRFNLNACASGEKSMSSGVSRPGPPQSEPTSTIPI